MLLLGQLYKADSLGNGFLDSLLAVLVDLRLVLLSVGKTARAA